MSFSKTKGNGGAGPSPDPWSQLLSRIGALFRTPRPAEVVDSSITTSTIADPGITDSGITDSGITAGPIRIVNRQGESAAFGLITLAAELHDADAPPATITVRVGGEEHRIAGDECCRVMPDGTVSVMFNVITHLLPNGTDAVGLRAAWADRRVAEFPPFHLAVANETPLAAAVAEDLRQVGASAVFGRIVDSHMFPYAEGRARAWFDEAVPDDVPLSFERAPDEDTAHRHLIRWGFAILPAPLPTTLIEEFRGEFGAAIESGRYSHQAGSSDRIHGAHYLPAGRRIWLHPPVIDFLKAHFRDPPCACQTLTFINGSEQSGHQDTIHLTPYPAGFMCGVWIALEDVKPESGELFVYPGSHRTPRLRAADLGLAKVTDDYSAYVAFDAAISELLREGGYERMAYRPKAGDILVWHENLIHGGSPRLDRGQSRLSIVSHYFAQGAVGYYDSRGEAATLEALPTV